MKRAYWSLAAALATALSGTAATTLAQDADVAPLFQRLDKNSDGKLTGDEVPEDQQRLFQRLLRLGDKNGDGSLTREEFAEANKQEAKPNVALGSDGDNRGDAKQRFEMLDRNKDGKVTLEEVPEPLRDRLKPLFDRSGKKELTFEDFSRMGQGGGRPDPAEMFKRFDKNSDGKLSKDELPPEARERLAPAFERLGVNEITLEQFQRLGERLGRPGQGNPEEMFGRLDTNGDGKLTLDEAPERARPLVEAALRRAGKDPSGSLTKDEFVKHLPPPRDGEPTPASERRPDADRPRDTERRPEGDRPRGGERAPAAERRADGDRPAGQPAARDGERRVDGDRPRDGERRPEGERPRDGERPAGRGLAFLQVLDTNRDGRLSKEELAKASDKFDELDRNHDGFLDAAELAGGPPPAGDRGRERGREEPARDGDARRESGRVDGSRETREGPGRPAGDANGRPGPIFQRLDRDGDGKISKDEAPEQLKERFGMLDTNGDGFLSLDEFRAGAALMGERLRDAGRPARQAPPEERPAQKRE